MVKEALRVLPPVPFLIPRRVEQEVDVSGYTVPKNSQVLVNAWAIGQDPSLWENPLEFKPERFMESEQIYADWGRRTQLFPIFTERTLASEGKNYCASIFTLQENTMSKNREPEMAPESGTEEDDTSSEEIGSSDSDSEQEESQPQIIKKPSTAPGPKKPNSSSSSKPHLSSSEESDSESGSESESDQPDPAVKPLAPRPMEYPQETATRKLIFKPSGSGHTSPTKSVAAKRSAVEKGSDVKDSKKPNKTPEIKAENSEKKSNDDSKKQLFQRLWSEDDEIVILKGMLDYTEKKKTDPVADLNAFHDFIRKNLHVDVTRAQLQAKIRRLKKKYVNNKSKERTLTKSHEQRTYELSKKIWGTENGVDNEGEKVIASPKEKVSGVRKTSSKRAMVETGDSKEAKLVENANGDEEVVAGKSMRFHGGNFEDWILKTGVELIGEEKRVETEREWKKQRVEETALYLKKLDLIHSRIKQVLDVLKSSNP